MKWRQHLSIWCRKSYLLPPFLMWKNYIRICGGLKEYVFHDSGYLHSWSSVELFENLLQPCWREYITGGRLWEFVSMVLLPVFALLCVWSNTCSCCNTCCLLPCHLPNLPPPHTHLDDGLLPLWNYETKEALSSIGYFGSCILSQQQKNS